MRLCTWMCKKWCFFGHSFDTGLGCSCSYVYTACNLLMLWLRHRRLDFCSVGDDEPLLMYECSANTTGGADAAAVVAAQSLHPPRGSEHVATAAAPAASSSAGSAYVLAPSLASAPVVAAVALRADAPRASGFAPAPIAVGLGVGEAAGTVMLGMTGPSANLASSGGSAISPSLLGRGRSPANGNEDAPPLLNGGGVSGGPEFGRATRRSRTMSVITMAAVAGVSRPTGGRLE
jgi:hypothetical protein